MKTVHNNNEGIRTTEEQPRLTKPSYAQAVKVNTNTLEKGNSTSHNENKPNTNIKERLRSLILTYRRPKQRINRSRNNSKADLSSNYKYQQEINQIKEEIKVLKQTNNHQEETKEIKTSNTSASSKNKFQASVSRGGQEKNI